MFDTHSCVLHIFISSHDSLKSAHTSSTLCSDYTHVHRSTTCYLVGRIVPFIGPQQLLRPGWPSRTWRSLLVIDTPSRDNMPSTVRPNQKIFVGRNVNLCRPLQPPALASNCRARVGHFPDSAPQKPALVLDDSVPDPHAETTVPTMEGCNIAL